jgi:hypothetical protein
MVPREMWEVEPFRAVGPIAVSDDLETLSAKFGRPDSLDTEFSSGANVARWSGVFSADFLPDGRLFDIGTVGMNQPVSFRSIELRGTISRLENRLAKHGLRFDPPDGPHSESFVLREFGIALFVPLGTRTVRSVAVTLLDEEIPPNTWEPPRATKEGNLALLAKMLAEEKAKEQAERH